MADGAWSWFQDPRAVHYVGAHDRTYIGYVTSAGDIDVVSQVNGLVRTVRRPSISVTYEARMVASATHLPATSARATVRVG